MMGKGCTRRPPQISYEEEHLNWLLFQRKITFKEYEKRHKKLEAEGKIYRKPRYKLRG